MIKRDLLVFHICVCTKSRWKKPARQGFLVTLRFKTPPAAELSMSAEFCQLCWKGRNQWLYDTRWLFKSISHSGRSADIRRRNRTTVGLWWLARHVPMDSYWLCCWWCLLCELALMFTASVVRTCASPPDRIWLSRQSFFSPSKGLEGELTPGNVNLRCGLTPKALLCFHEARNRANKANCSKRFLWLALPFPLGDITPRLVHYTSTGESFQSLAFFKF